MSETLPREVHEASVLIIIPTFNEKENLPKIVPAIHEVLPGAHVLVVDDNSPDGTGPLADGIAAEDSRVHVLHRQGKEGLGKAYLAGFAWALSAERGDGYDYIFEMDADFSHQPRYLTDMLAAAVAGADLVIGSRYVKGGGTANWGWSRRMISRWGGRYSRLVLGLNPQDVTAGFKCFRRATLEALDFERVISIGFGFQIELNFRVQLMGFRIDEVPIIFPDREEGTSKMSGSIVSEALLNVWKLRFHPDIRSLRREMKARARGVK
jgi:dolichol-phosphate mannosyltransferase